MANTDRRSFLGAAMGAIPLAFMAQRVTAQSAKPQSTVAHSMTPQSVNPSTPRKAVPVRHGEDRLGEPHTLGVSSTAFKVITRDSGGDLFIMEHTNGKKGGPPRHLHHHEDEWFYVLEGEYVAEIGSDRFQLKPGDSILGPREMPHVWAFVGETKGKLLIAFAPANQMEAFFPEEMSRHRAAYSKSASVDDKERFREYGMELLGPPLSIG
jgi:mannose-6-phosphate isomerase-like protein (cupin superfamily)